MPIQEEEKASGRTSAKVRPILKPSPTSGWDSTLMKQSQWIDIEMQESKDPHCFHVSKLITRLLRHSKQVRREEDGGVHYDQVIDECKKKLSDDTGYWLDEMKKHYALAPHWSLEKWISVLANGESQKKRFQCCVNPNYSLKFLYLRAIQGHSGSTINPASQYNVLIPEGFTEYTCHDGNGKELRSIVNHGQISGGVSLKTGRHAVFFIVVNPMDNQDDLGETLCDLSKARIAPYKNILKNFQDALFWCNLKLAQQRGLQFYQTKSNAVLLVDTLPAEFIVKAICMKTKDQIYQRESARPRVVLRRNSQSGSQDLPVQEARSSWESHQDGESYGETRSNTADYRVPGISISPVKLQDARRQNNVTKLVEMFEKHQHEEQFLKDMNQKQEINRYSEESQQLLVETNHTEIFELCENSSKRPCLDCISSTEIGIIYCSCGRNLMYKRSATTTQKANNDYTSIPCFFNKKILLEDQSTAALKNHVLQGEGDA